MNPVHTIDFPGRLFKIEPHPSGEALVVELRGAAERVVRLAWVELEAEGKCEFGPEMEWWCGLERVYVAGVLVHRFEDPNLPVHRGLEWWSLPGFGLQWRAPGARLLGALQDGLWVGMVDGSEGVLDLEAGVLRGDDEGEWESEAKGFEEERFQHMGLPESRASAEYSDIPRLSALPSVTGTVSTLELDGQTLIAWHSEQAAGGFCLWLAALENGVEKWLICLEKDLQKLNPEPFFVLKQHVIWLSGPNSLSWRKL